jgi:hypothetical protein
MSLLTRIKSGLKDNILTFNQANVHTGAETHEGIESHTGAETHEGDETHTGQEWLKRLPSYISMTADATAAYATHSGKVVRTTVTNIDLTLPAASEVGAHYKFLVGVAATAGGATLKTTGSDTINGGTTGEGLINTAATDVVGDYVEVISDGSDYFVIGQNGIWAAG